MPANKKYLTQSPFQRVLKITAGFVGGFIITELLHMVLTLWFDFGAVMFTIRYAGFILWAGLMIVAFLAKNGWKIWGIYLLIILILATILYFGSNINSL
ncbi:hypothetical protein JM658_07845 [Joostella atrarenae]|uniref:Uncharacterized protein n=1 Tax=Joostella atrarenae TaxID=679257 RepID=A0ABS9J2V1_9FLAO|nr:hypothetical protein [Joostella atrarenae]MCF8714739.1 hypothetical protein [Joostella atrarenae]